ncbi:Creatinase/aminopeptidase [Choiromyces venosus 120613-1]|uniref:Creatinase/aminopeptidase n=1 Tax=Choiromyces venosus 120613-1 TaxID=1336337 RepID=A0A3N4JH49_9PEZI|nr:Creatinase/aminopeptidase [Choiromyces venosus 120613-1]
MTDKNEKGEGAAAAESNPENEFTLSLTKYNDAAAIAHRVLAKVCKLAIEGDGKTILSLCEEGDKLLDEECSKVYKGKKISKGRIFILCGFSLRDGSSGNSSLHSMSESSLLIFRFFTGIAFPTTVSPNDILTPYTPLATDPGENEIAIKKGDVLKIQLGAQLDGYPAIVGDTIIVGQDAELTDDQKNLLQATHYCNEALLRLLLPSDIHPLSTPEKPYKQPSAYEITQILNKIAATYDCTIVESTTSFNFLQNEIEGKKRLVIHPGEGMPKSEGTPEVGDIWGVELALSKGSGKLKDIPGKRPTLHKKTDTKVGLKRQTSKTTFTEVNKKFGNFPFGLRQLEDERTAKMGIVECVRSNVIRQFEILGEKDGSITSRLFTTIAITKTGINKITAPSEPDLEKLKTDKVIENTEILDLLKLPLNKPKKKKKPAAKKEE